MFFYFLFNLSIFFIIDELKRISDSLFSSESYRNYEMNINNYKEALNAKVHYILKLYEKLNENTVMIITSDASNIIFLY